MSGFAKAQRYLTNPTIAITGPTGSGKTFSALRLAAGISKAMGKPFAVIDTENGSASLYSEFFEFDTLNITPPFTTEKYIAAINLAEKAGYCALVCDSITHAWAGEGGLLEQKDLLDSRPNSNRWTNWQPIKTKDLKFKNAYLHSSIPFFIATMRSKMEYAQSQNQGEKAKVQKVGMAPVQAEGIEYEFSLVFDVAMNHECEVSKDRTHIFDKEKIFQITEETGMKLVAWRESGKNKPVAAPTVPPKPENEKQQHPADEPQKFPEDDLDAYLGHPPGSAEEAASYKVEFGTHIGKMLKDIPENVLRDYCNWLQDESARTQKPINPAGPVGKLLDKAGVFLGVH